jgi:hypothetical protein
LIRIIICGLDGEVKWWTESQAQPGGYYQHICGLVEAPEGGRLLRLKVLCHEINIFLILKNHGSTVLALMVFTIFGALLCGKSK